ncbi:MAG: TIM barrel protein [Chloroflexota bacterium]
MLLGIGSYTYGWSSGCYGSNTSQQADFTYLTAYDLIDRAVQLDVPIVQICVKPDLIGLHDEDLRILRNYADTNDKALEIGTIGSAPEHLDRFLHIAEVLGAKLVRTIFTSASPGLIDERNHILQIADGFAEKQITLAIENHEAASVLDLQALCQDMDNDYVGVCLDTVNSLGRGEGLREVTAALMPFTKCLHIKDFTVVRHTSDMEMTITGAPAGEGKLDIPTQLQMLHGVQPDASVVLEQWVPLYESLEKTVQIQDMWAENGIKYLKRHIC